MELGPVFQLVPDGELNSQEKTIVPFLDTLGSGRPMRRKSTMMPEGLVFGCSDVTARERSRTVMPSPAGPASVASDADLRRRLVKVLWREVVKISNPWCTAVASGLSDYRPLREEWNRRQIDLTRSLFAVTVGDVEPTEALLAAALDFMEE